MTRTIDAVKSDSSAPVLTGSSTYGGLQAIFDQLMAADAEMRAIDSLPGRRAFAKKSLLPLLHTVDQAMRADGRAHGFRRLSVFPASTAASPSRDGQSASAGPPAGKT
jgi:hypothetical protein